MMTTTELRNRLSQNLAQAGITPLEIRVQPDLIGGWRIVVIANEFEGKSVSERKRIALADLDEADIEWSDFLTSAEKEWAGSLPTDSQLEDLPLWAEALARGHSPQSESDPILYASEIDEDLPKPIVATFYSVRGGVGRSTALVYTAQILASRGRSVICVDLDIEAPGLAALLGIEDDVTNENGILALLAALDRGETPDFSRFLLRVSDKVDLYCLPAGVMDAYYARLLNQVDLQAWYTEERNPLRAVLEGLRNKLPFTPDVILLDSRTGISTISAPLLFDLADLSVILFFPHPQTRMGTQEVVRALLSSRNQRSVNGHRLSPEPRFIVSPVPSSRLAEIASKYKNRAVEWISEWMSTADGHAADLATTISDIVHFISYKEDLAASDRASGDPQTWQDYEPVANWIEQFLPSSEEARAPAISEGKADVLSELAFSAGTAEHQPDFLPTFVETDFARKALDPNIPLVLGRKGAGKTAIFRRLLEKPQIPSIPVTAPAPLRGSRGWTLTADGFEAADDLLRSHKRDWRHFWAALSCLSVYYGLPQPAREMNPEVLNLLPMTLPDELTTIHLLGRLFELPTSGLLMSNWLERLDVQAPNKVMLLFDGLDTGFGTSEQSRERRRAATEGLFGFLVDQTEKKSLRYKVVMRADIWRTLRFENKSHFYGRSVSLDWRDQTTYFKVVLKQALQSNSFRILLMKAAGGDKLGTIDLWGDAEVRLAWNLLVGERMKGEKTAFTRNWVWNRLADANDDHSPRYLLQLFREVLGWEKSEQQRSMYDKSIVRPRALIYSLPAVSNQALQALREEFPELEELLNTLRSLGRTPVPSTDLAAHASAIPLAREVGLLGIYEGTEENVDRYKVPDIYRYALDMTRKGQA
jgi:MinD-like ATPase involved in chromosome partitioning or flagellar assembly